MRVCTRCGQNKNVETGYKTPRGRVCKTCQKGGRRASTKNARLQESFNITMDQWQALLQSQGGVCAICRGKRPMYDTDHDHGLERAGMSIEQTIRGLLCKRCNRRLLPAALDDVEILGRAIDYLTYARDRAQMVLFMVASGYKLVGTNQWEKNDGES